MTLRAASGGRLRPSLTAAARGASLTPGRDGETAPVSRTEKRHQVGSVRQTSKGRTFLPTPDGEEAEIWLAFQLITLRGKRPYSFDIW